MDTKSRIRRILLLEKMERFPEYARTLGLEDRSSFRPAQTAPERSAQSTAAHSRANR